ncbi:MAG TPA: kelch repeat-containing protein [Gemmatimonadaceae bacterium]|nr:kelch repeat-containing protein [Gemmatimonadaceae bacterium]
MPTARCGAAAVGADGHLYVISGNTLSQRPFDASGGVLTTLEAFDLAEQTWRSLAPLEEGRTGICAIAIE